MNTEILRESLLRELPPIFPRTDVGRLTGGMINAGTLTNAERIGGGPPAAARVRYGRRIGYIREPFVDWFISTLKEVEYEIG
jgi:hypothetical protein